MNAMGNGSKRLVIRLLERRDLEEARLLHNDDSTFLQLTDISHVSEAQQEQWFQSISTSRSSRRYVARLRVGGCSGSTTSTRGIATPSSAVVAAQRRNGYASEMFDYMLRNLIDQCGLHRVGLVTLASNTPSLALYRKLGFVEEGRERQAIFRDGQYHDLIAMGLLAAEWRKHKSIA